MFKRLLNWLGVKNKPAPFDPENTTHYFYHDNAPEIPSEFQGFAQRKEHPNA